MRAWQWMTTVVLGFAVMIGATAAGAAEPGPIFQPYPDGTATTSGAPLLRYENADLPGNDIAALVVGASSFEECADRCLADHRCNAFTFNSLSKICVPKSEASRPQRYEGAISGVLNMRTPPPGYAAPVATPNACSVGGAGKCPGCSIACNAGTRPVCTAPIEGVAAQCQRDAWCRCAPG